VIPTGVRIFLCPEPVEMRYGFDRMTQTARGWGQDPQEGGVLFVFANRGAILSPTSWHHTRGSPPHESRTRCAVLPRRRVYWEGRRYTLTEVTMDPSLTESEDHETMSPLVSIGLHKIFLRSGGYLAPPVKGYSNSGSRGCIECSQTANFDGASRVRL
jgi:hypothetical protein